MNALFKLNQNTYKNASFILESYKSILFKTSINSVSTQPLFFNNKSTEENQKLLLNSNKLCVSSQFERNLYTFTLGNKLSRYRRATRPKKTSNNSVNLNYEQAQFAEKLGLTKSWNIWNTCEFIFKIDFEK